MKKIFSFLCLIAAIVVAMSACSSTKEEKGTSETGNAALDNIFARKSVRTYLNKGVEKEKIDLMLRAGMAAPSGKDVRPWEFIVVSDRAKLDSMAAALPYAKMLTQARNAIIVCGDSVRSSYWYLDCSAAAQNILLAAESLGDWGLYGRLPILMKTVCRWYANIPIYLIISFRFVSFLSAIRLQKRTRNRNLTRKRYIIISISKQKFCLFNNFLTFASELIKI